ncbi:MAG: DUF4276 family protein [Deltaproteobacteria bacterium]|nr:DUF4276 family protein [Deltaproteobacteria bacterium]
MSVEHIEFLVEELSMEAALRLLLPKVIGNRSFDVHPFSGKADLLARLPNRLRGYAKWIPNTWRIVVLVDRDSGDCRDLKTRLEKMASDAKLPTRSNPRKGRYTVVNRLAIEELEAWYFGDWEAVRAAFPRVPKSIPAAAKYRDPDAVTGGTWEAFESVLQKVGYHESGLRKIEAARDIAENMVPERNRSRSFQVLRQALLEMAAP